MRAHHGLRKNFPRRTFHRGWKILSLCQCGCKRRICEWSDQHQTDSLASCLYFTLDGIVDSALCPSSVHSIQHKGIRMWEVNQPSGNLEAFDYTDCRVYWLKHTVLFCCWYLKCITSFWVSQAKHGYHQTGLSLPDHHQPILSSLHMYCTALYSHHCTALYCHHCTVLYCTVLYCNMLHCTILCCTVLYCTILYYTVWYCTIMYGTVLYCKVLYYTVLYYTVLYCTVRYYAVLLNPLFTWRFVFAFYQQWV